MSAFDFNLINPDLSSNYPTQPDEQANPTSTSSETKQPCRKPYAQVQMFSDDNLTGCNNLGATKSLFVVENQNQIPMTKITMGADLMVKAVGVLILTTIILLVMLFSRASTTPSPDKSVVPNTSSSSSVSTWKFDVFLSFRGDTRKTFVDHLYTVLVERTMCPYKDGETLLRGDAIHSTLLKAIQESHIALIIYFQKYADSSWCLDELAYILKCEERGQIIMLIFCDVDSSNVRKQKVKFGKVFSKDKSANNNKVESWRNSLRNASNIVGWEPKIVANGHEAKCIK